MKTSDRVKFYRAVFNTVREFFITTWIILYFGFLLLFFMSDSDTPVKIIAGVILSLIVVIYINKTEFPEHVVEDVLRSYADE